MDEGSDVRIVYYLDLVEPTGQKTALMQGLVVMIWTSLVSVV
jgi:hypothetical protein